MLKLNSPIYYWSYLSLCVIEFLVISSILLIHLYYWKLRSPKSTNNIDKKKIEWLPLFTCLAFTSYLIECTFVFLELGIKREYCHIRQEIVVTSFLGARYF